MDAYQVKGTNWWGAIDAEGRLLWKREDIHWLGAFVEGYAICVNREFRTGLITATGEVVIEPKYSLLRDYACGLVAYRETEKGKFGYLDNTGKVVIPPKYLSANPFSVEGLAIVQKGKQVRVCIDRNGTELWEIEAEACASFSEGLAPYLVKKGGWGYVDISGQSVITPALDWPAHFLRVLQGSGQAVVSIHLLTNMEKGFPRHSVWYRVGIFPKAWLRSKQNPRKAWLVSSIAPVTSKFRRNSSMPARSRAALPQPDFISETEKRSRQVSLIQVGAW